MRKGSRRLRRHRYRARIHVTSRGVLPDLFREGKGVVAEGTLMADGTFVADQVLAKHDENYMPPDAAEGHSDEARAEHAGLRPPPNEAGR